MLNASECAMLTLLSHLQGGYFVAIDDLELTALLKIIVFHVELFFVIHGIIPSPPITFKTIVSGLGEWGVLLP